MDTLAGRTTTGVELPEALTAHLDGIRALCERYRIRALYVFGSAVHGDFDPETSDLDFVVDVGDRSPGFARRLFAFSDALERLVGREIDIITEQSSGTARFDAEIEATKVAIHVST